MILSSFLTKWPLRIAIVVGGLGVIALYSYRATSTPTIKYIKTSGRASTEALTVSGASSQTLSQGVLTTNSLPQGNSQTGAAASGQGSSASLQSNVSVNDPSVSGSPLVQSLYEGNQ